MIARRRVAVAGLVLGLAATAPAESREPSSARPDLRSLFPHRAEIHAERPGLTRLPLPPEVLAECQAGLSDLRVLDSAGREVAYLVDGGPPPRSFFEERRSYQPEILAAYRETEERDSAPDLRRETYHLSIPADEADRRWDLVVSSGRARFVWRFEIEAARDGEEGSLLARGSVFRLREPLRQRLAVTLPPLDAEYLVVRLEGEDDLFLEPAFRLVTSRVLPDHEQVRVDLEVLRRSSRDGRTVVELERPRGLVPDRLDVITSTGSFNRRFEVTDQGSGGVSGALGQATLYRLAGLDGVERLEVPLRPAGGDGLRVVIEDGDSPPLEGLRFRAVLRRPVLIFDLGGGVRPGGELLFGGGRAHRPSYDLAALLAIDGRRLQGEGARLGAALRDPARMAEARLGPTGPNPRWDPTPALAFAMRPGNPTAAWRFEHRRSLSVPETEEGLLRTRLGAETVARCRPDLADLRLVDAEARQWPYLLNRSGTAERLALGVSEPRRIGDKSIYTLELPASPLRVERLLLDTPAPFLDRPFELLGAPAGNGRQLRVLARGRLRRLPDEAGELEIALDGKPVVGLELRIDDGDDPSLAWSSAAVRVPLPELYFAAPAGDYALLFGDPEARAPRYELEQVRDLVLAVDSTRVRAGVMTDNPARGALARFRGAGGWQRVTLWSALVLAAGVLAGITLKLARQESAPTG